MPRRSSPEALGSPAGYHLPPGHRLLRPHVRLSIPPAALWIMQPAFARRSVRGWVREGPQFTLRVCAPVPPSVPRWILRLHLAASSPHALAFAASVPARHPLPHTRRFSCERVTRLQSFLYGTARELACPSPPRTFTFELSPPESPLRDVEYHYAGKQPISPRPDFHRQDTQPYGLRTDAHG